MPSLEGMHSPGSATAHLLPPAGVKTRVDEVYRFHRVVPMYPPDPCIRPNEADLVCPPENFVPKNNATMPPAGVSTAHISDVFSFYKAREGTPGSRPCQAGIRQAGVVQQPCPCSNSSGTPAGNFDLRFQGISTQAAGELQISEGAGYQSPMSSGYGHTSSWPMPGNGGVHPQVAGQGNVPRQSQPRLNNSPTGYTVEGHRNPTPYSAQQMHPAYFGQAGSHPYICQPVYDRRYLQDCPQQDGPPADSYTFL